MVFADGPPSIAICVGCFFFFRVFDAMCMGFFMVLVGRPPLVAICVAFWGFLCF